MHVALLNWQSYTIVLPTLIYWPYKITHASPIIPESHQTTPLNPAHQPDRY